MTRVCKLDLRVVGPPPDAATMTLVLLHGFGAPGDDLVALARVIDTPPATRFVFPAAPLELYGDARAWWMLDLARLDRARAGHVEDRSDEVPDGLAEARDQIDALIGDLIAEGAGQIVLGGFSQGAMLSLDTALHTKHPIAGLVIMSGTRINGAAWRTRIDRVNGMPILMSHGRADPLLPFAVAVSLRDQLRQAGAVVDWTEFAGGHEIPPSVLGGVSGLLARVGAR